MTRLLALLTALALLTSACTSAGDTPPGRSSHDCPKTYEGLESWAKAGFSGTVAVSRDGEFECVAGYGSADRADDQANTPDTVYSIGSVSKAFTATAIYRLVDDDRLRLGDRAGEILPSLRGPAARSTVRQLLLHTSGLTGSIGADHAPLGRAAAIRELGNLRRAYEPGARYLYSNAGYTLLALIVDELSDGYRDFMAKHILDTPDGSRSRGFWDGEPAAGDQRAVGYLDGGPTDHMGEFNGPHWALSGNGDLAMTTRDLATWTYALFSGDILSRRSTRAVGTGQIVRDDGASATAGWVRFPAAKFGEPVVATSGGGGGIGHDVVVAWLPRSKRVVTIASNTPVVRAEDLLTAIAPALVAGETVPPPDRPHASVDPAVLRDAAGTYRLDRDSSFDVSARDNELTITAYGPEAVETLFPRPANVSTDLVSTHEEAVLDLLQGETDEGREERDLFESDFGEITEIELAGTSVIDGELRTYVTLHTETDSVLGWYALDEAGAIAGAEVPTDPPTSQFVPLGGKRFRSDDPSGDAPDVTLTFERRGFSLDGPDGSVRAHLTND